MRSGLSDTLTWQPSLLGLDAPGFDPRFPAMRRRFLAEGAWVDTAPAAVTGAESLFEALLDDAPWSSHDRPMYDRVVAEPRLTTRRWRDPPAVVRRLGAALGERYGLDLGVITANLYRDGSDSVAWHGDRIGRKRVHTVVAILSLGATRRFLLRPNGGGASVRILPAAGDVLVMGGTCQRTWQHSVPKCAFAGPRVSVMFREGY